MVRSFVIVLVVGLTVGLAAPTTLTSVAAADIGSSSAAPPATTPVAADASATPADEAPSVEKDREWLVAYLLANEGYRIDQIEKLEEQVASLSETQLQTLLSAYRDKGEAELKREAYAAWRQQALARVESLQAQRSQSADRHRSALNQAANLAQSRLDGDRRQSMEFNRHKVMRPALMAFPQNGFFFGGFF